MKNIVNHEKFGEIIFIESYWSGRKEIVINGVKLTKIDKQTYKYRKIESLKDEFGQVIYNEYGAPLTKEVNKTFNFKGNFIYGATLTCDDEEIVIAPKAKWYEIMLGLIAFIFVIIWGSSVELVSIFPVVGGAIGGAISAGLGFYSVLVMKSKKKVVEKVLIGLGFAALSIFICFIVALMIIG